MKVKITNERRITGLTEAARRLGCSKAHLHFVITGERESRRLRERAKAMGIVLPKVK